MKETVGRVTDTKEFELSNGGERFGLQIKSDKGNKTWVNGWGSPPEHVDKGDKVKVPWEPEEYKGNLRKEVQDSDDIEVLEKKDGGDSSSASAEISQGSPREAAAECASRVMQGTGKPDATDLQALKVLTEEFTSYIETGEWDNLEDLIVAQKSESKKEEEPDE